MTPCPACESSHTNVAAHLDDEDRLRPEGFDLVRCHNCGLGFVQPLLSEEALAEYYPDAFYGAESATSKVARAVFHAFRARVLRRAGVTRGALLDIGCGDGGFLAFMQKRGFSVAGVETSLAGRTRASALGVAASASLEALPPGVFDVVTLWQVLEHVQTPLQTLLDAKARLAPGGNLVVSVPNWGSREARAFGRHWFHLDVPRHQLHFTRGALEGLLTRAGLRVADVQFSSVEYNPFGLIQSAANVLPIEKNALYKVVKRGVPLDTLNTRTRRAVRMTLAALPVLAGGAVAIDAVAAALGQSATMTFTARVNA